MHMKPEARQMPSEHGGGDRISEDERERLQEEYLYALEQADPKTFADVLSEDGRSLFEEYDPDFRMRVAAIAAMKPDDVGQLRIAFRQKTNAVHRPVLHDLAATLQAYDAVTSWRWKKK